MKYLVEKVIKGQKYYYLQYHNKTALLGRSIPENLKQRILDFFEKIAEENTALIPETVKQNFPFKDLTGLEKKHFFYLCLSQSELFSSEYRDFLVWYSVLFTYNSNRAEGSKVSEPEIEKYIFSKKRIPKTRTDREIFNSYHALKFAMSKQMKWNPKHIRHVHHLLLQGMEDNLIIGKWKNENNTAPGNQPTADFKAVPEQMKKLLAWLNDEIKKKHYPPLLALQFYTRFEKIHPFLDGNGRVGRILLNAILHRFKYMPVIFFTENHKSHCEALRQAIEARAKKFNLHFLEQAEKTSKLLREKIGI